MFLRHVSIIVDQIESCNRLNGHSLLRNTFRKTKALYRVKQKTFSLQPRPVLLSFRHEETVSKIYTTRYIFFFLYSSIRRHHVVKFCKNINWMSSGCTNHNCLVTGESDVYTIFLNSLLWGNICNKNQWQVTFLVHLVMSGTSVKAKRFFFWNWCNTSHTHIEDYFRAVTVATKLSKLETFSGKLESLFSNSLYTLATNPGAHLRQIVEIGIEIK